MADTIQNLLTDSVKKCNIRQARILLDRGADPNYVNEEEGVSPMHLAAGIGVDPLNVLLQYNGNPNIRLEDGTTPVHVSAIWGFADCMQILLANGGDPFLRDQEGFTAEDLAMKYQHDDVLQVLRHDMFLLRNEEEHTTTPMFTYRRLSMESNSSESPSLIQCAKNCSNNSVETSLNDSMYDTQGLEDYLHQFARHRRSSLYLTNVQRQFDKFFKNGQKTHLFDVTSPDHPYVERRESPAKEIPPYSNASLESPSDVSCDSFVTCDGESLNQDSFKDSMDLNGSLSNEELSPCSPNKCNTLVKNSKYIDYENEIETGYQCKRLFPQHEEQTGDSMRNWNVSKNSKKRSGESRRTKYCIRESPNCSQEIISEQKCEFCGGYAVKRIYDSIVCASCEKLGLELDELVGASGDNLLDMVDNLDENSEFAKLEILPDLLETLPDTLKNATSTVKKNSWLLAEQCRDFVRHKTSDSKNTKDFAGTDFIQKVNVDDKNGHKSERKDSNTKIERDLRTEELNDLTEKFGRTSLNKFSNEDHLRRGIVGKVKSGDFEVSKLNDSMVSHISSTVNELDKAHMFNDSVLTMDGTFLDRTDLFHRKESILHSKNLVVNSDGKYGDMEIGKGVETKNVENDNGFACSQEHNDLWRQIQACKCENLARKSRGDVLDTAFCGRQSMSSIYSDGSTVDYVYTDKENGITLVERHLPSLCGSQGSRRSIDSQLSANTEVAVISDSGLSNKSNRGSISSEDTVLYNWKENAMVMSDDNGNGCSDVTDSATLSQKLLNLDNETLRSKLCCAGDDPGPVTKTTRQTYLRRLSQLQRDPECKVLTCKSPEYPPELRQALNGNLDISEMHTQETKMVAAFQNPDRLRRWREGTLKSSFNYILLDPRVTRNLPNRAVNMNDQDVFHSFISATFYIGKGKRARPYCHLYEAIKQQQKNNTSKMSKKVEKILEIWGSGMGVVSLHCFQSVIPVEAYTREACMIDAVGLNHITNQKRGDYYGVSVTFSMKERRKMGVYLLKKALQIFLAEGERQIAPLDIKKD